MNAPIEINPELDARVYAEAYAREGMVRIPDFLTRHSAERLEAALLKATPWGLSLSDAAGQGQWLSGDELAALGRDGVGRRMSETLAASRSGFGFVFLAYPIIEALLAGREPGHPAQALVERLNTPDVVAFAAAVTGEPALTKIDAQATWFRPGDFLALHNDTGVGERRAAYTLGMTRDWRADWGGQLLFHDEAGDVTRGLRPAFNVLTLFRTPQWHSVAPVAAYAGTARLSITGWLRDDPPGGAA